MLVTGVKKHTQTMSNTNANINHIILCDRKQQVLYKALLQSCMYIVTDGEKNTKILFSKNINFCRFYFVSL